MHESYLLGPLCQSSGSYRQGFYRWHLAIAIIYQVTPACRIATEQPIIEVEITLLFVAVRHMHVQQTVWLASIDNHITGLGTNWSAMIHTLGLVLLSRVSIRSRARTLSESSFRDKFTYIEVIPFWTYNTVTI